MSSFASPKTKSRGLLWDFCGRAANFHLRRACQNRGRKLWWKILEAEKILRWFAGGFAVWNGKSLDRHFFSPKIAWEFLLGWNLGEMASHQLKITVTKTLLTEDHGHANYLISVLLNLKLIHIGWQENFMCNRSEITDN